MENIQVYEKKFLSIYKLILTAMTLYFFISTIKNNSTSIVLWACLVALFGLLIANTVLSMKNFYGSKKCFCAVKILMLVALSVMLLDENVQLIAFSLAFYILVCFELILVQLLDKIKDRILCVISFLPFAFAITFKIFFSDFGYLFLGIVFLLILIGLYFLLSTYTNELGQKLDMQVIMWKDSQDANEALKASQEKIKKMYDQIAEQKFRMEKTNEQLDRMTSEMYIQNELLRYISSTLDLDQLMDLVTDAIVGAIGVDTCTLIVQNIDDSTFSYKSKSNYDVQSIINQFEKAIKNGDMASYFNSTLTHMDKNVEVTNYSFINQRPVGSLIIVPLIRQDSVYGLMISEHAATEFFSEYNVQFFESIATQITIAVNNANIFKRMEDMATKDGLTGIYNRRHFQLQLNSMFEEIKRNNGNLSIVLFDIDKFKSVNDTYGHLFGDEAIKMVARLANKYAKQYGGIAGRYGGEEFVMAYPGRNMEETLKFMEDLHNEIKNEPLNYNNEKDVYINVSMGITYYPEFCDSAEGLLNRADNAMYYSKKHGRGRITLDSWQLDINQEK